MNYSIVDIETTGGSHGNRITEIAICKTDGKKVIDTYETLIDPEVYIPHSITLLTGITNEMVAAAPTFDQVADKIKEFMQDTVFIAHNVSFDYSIIKNHYYDLGEIFNMKKLCTVRLSRGILDEQPSYSLGKLCNALGIVNHKRHRAMGDAAATAVLFHLLSERDNENFIEYSLNQLNREATIPPNLDKSEFEKLPETPGVYYMLGKNMEVLYVGKAKNIKNRIITHFNEKSRKKSELLRRIHHLGFEETGNELIALLLESAEIKKHYPFYNRAQKSKHSAFHVGYYKGQDGILRIDVFNKKYGAASLASFTSMVMARDYLYQVVENHDLCPKYSGLQRTKTECYKGTDCLICSEQISVDEYNSKVIDLKNQNAAENLLIFGRGRTNEESSVIYINQGEYQGYTFLENQTRTDQAEVIARIEKQKANADTKRIIDYFIKSNTSKHYEIVNLEPQTS